MLFTFPFMVWYDVGKGVCTISIEKKIAMALAYAGMTQAELARKMGQTPANFNQKIKRNTLRLEDLDKIAEIIGCKWVCQFQFDDGTAIG